MLVRDFYVTDNVFYGTDKIIKKEPKNKIMAEQIRPTVTVGPLIFNKEGKLFLMQSPKWHNKWVIPGGKIELGETMEHAIKREIKEETNLELYDIAFLTVLENIFDPVFIKKKHFIHINFTAKVKEPFDVKLNEEAIAHKWVTLAEAEKMDVEPYTRKLILLYKEKHKGKI